MNRYGFKIIPQAKRTYRGKRARRQAFYDRQRMARLMRRIASSVEWAGAYDDSLRDALVYGLGAMEIVAGRAQRIEPTVLWDRGDGAGFTAEPLRDGEWPRAMTRTWSVAP